MSGHPHATQPAGNEAPRATGWGRQFVKFSFYRLRDELRQADAATRAEAGACLDALLCGSAERMLTRTYSTVGTRRDTDLLVWQVADELDTITDWHASLLNSPVGPQLERSASYLSMTMRSLYENPLHDGASGRDRLRADESGARYLFVYPMVKTREWYRLPKSERQRMMDEHIAIGHAYHGIRINTTYSYGLDDQEFVVAFEGDHPGEFLALVRELRESEASAFTERDTPMYTCRRMPLDNLLRHVGLAGVAT
ncbi:MAG: chlorite dismutase family protein [Dehalococcoidia bacterium]|nr:chlorite dismutase family protein [Dehalococcoidia bacterium]HRC61799.1 chlorite dismutase family protein [Dehalococcoidia bacterium]